MNIQLIAEIMGTVAFAISGAMLAIERKMDLFGIVFLGIVTALGCLRWQEPIRPLTVDMGTIMLL